MRILIVGADSKYAIEKPYLEYLAKQKEVDHIELFAAQKLFLDYYNQSIINKLLYRIGISSILKKVNNKLRKKVLEYKPDIVFVFKGMEIFPITLSWIKNQGIKLVNYNPDNPFIFSGRGSGNKNITDAISLYDLHLTYNESVKEKLEDTYTIPVELLPFGFDITDEVYQQAESEHEILKVCFLGNADTLRATFVTALADSGVEMDVYGEFWQKFISHPKINIHQSVYGTTFWKTLRKYRVQLNIMRPHNPDSHNMRTFEIPGIGGIELAPRTSQHQSFFEENTEIFLYDDIEDCIAKASYLLGIDKDVADGIRFKARRKSIENKYGYEDRSKQLVLYFKKLLNNH
jgi:spore maturation protein CgeB